MGTLTHNLDGPVMCSQRRTRFPLPDMSASRNVAFCAWEELATFRESRLNVYQGLASRHPISYAMECDTSGPHSWLWWSSSSQVSSVE